MTSYSPDTDFYARGKDLSEQVNPGMEDALRDRYDALVPGLSQTIVNVAYGQFYARGGVDEKTRLLATIASARAVGASREEIAEIIFQMTLYGGFPAMINAMNAAIEVFETEEHAQ